MKAPRLTIIESGSESKVYRTVFNGVAAILKEAHAKGRVDYLFEAFAYEALGKLGAQVPKVLSASPRQLFITEIIGKTLDDQFDLFDNKTIFVGIAKDLALCRNVKLKGFGPVLKVGNEYQGTFKTWEDFLSVTYSSLKESIHFNTDEKKVLTHYWNTYKQNCKLEQGTLVHGDFALSAIFVDKSAYVGTIDFGDAFIGDPLMDLAHFRFKEITKDYGQDTYNLLCESYTQSANIKTDIEPTVIFYMLYWAIVRVNDSTDETIRSKFLDKARVLIKQIS